jgi:ABC-2 type transport system permease protein
MNATVLSLAAQALLGRRRFWLLLTFPALVLALTVLVTVLTDSSTAGWSVIGELGYALVVPLVAVLAASSVLGPEVDDGSVVYLLSKPVSRHAVAVSKWVVAWVATLVAGAVPLLVAGLVVGDVGRALGWTVAAAVAGTAYSALFVMISALTRHAVVVSLIFVLIWEALLGGFLSGVAWLSIGQWGIEVGHAVSTALASPVTLPWALVASALVTLGAVWFTGDRLRSFTMRGDE